MLQQHNFIKNSNHINAFFKTIFDNAAMGIGIADLDGTPIQSNKALLDMLGYTHEEIVQHSFSDFTHPEDINEDLSLMQDLIEDKIDSYTLEKRYITKNRDIIWAKLTVSLIRDSEDKPEYVVAMIEDITETKRALGELHESRKTVENILESTSDAFIALDRNWNFVYINHLAQELLKKDSKELLGKNMWDKFPDLIGTTVYREFKNSMDNQTPVVLEKYYETIDSWIHLHAYPSEKLLSVYFKNITEQKILDNELKYKKEQLSLVFETIPNGIVILNKNGQPEYMNPTAKEQMGLDNFTSYEDIKTTTFTLDGKPYPFEESPYYIVMRDKKPIKNIEFISKRHGADDMILSTNAAPILDDNGEVSSILMSTTDVTEIRKAEQKARELNSRLERLSLCDGLTGINNRRCFDDYLDKEWKRGYREGTPLSLILIDIDNFKDYNDNYGHQEGDSALKKVANELENLVKRPGDLVARYGGEEFAVVLPNTDEIGAEYIAEILRTGIRALKIRNDKSEVDEFITISLGLTTTIPKEHSSAYELIGKADSALYMAKQQGRNRCVTYNMNCVL